MKNSYRNYHRLTVHLVNFGKKKDFQTTHTFNNINNESEARNIIRVMLQNSNETDAELARKIRKVYYNGKELLFRSEQQEETNNGWLIR